jgi:hypothetical protein
MRFGKFQSLVSIMVLVLQLAVVGYVDADGCIYQLPPIQWACQPLLEAGGVELEVQQISLNQRSWGLCDRIRGGRLHRKDKQVLEAQNISETETVVIEKPQFPDVDYSLSPYATSLFQENDGSKTDPDGIPSRYLRMQNNRRDQAKKALDATLKWREENDINTILARPHHQFDICKTVFPHYFCGRDDTNHVILLQRPGLIDLPLAQANGLTGEDLLNHYVYEMEYLWQILEPAADATMTSVIDLTGLNLSLLTKPELLNVVQMFCSTMDAHFPLRAHKTLLINSPRWFGAIFKIISPLLRESTKEKITILSKGKKQDEAIRTLLSECPVPEDTKLDEMPPADMEQNLRAFVSSTDVLYYGFEGFAFAVLLTFDVVLFFQCVARLNEAGVAMQPVVG